LVRLLGGVEAPTSGRIRRNMSISWPIGMAAGCTLLAPLAAADNRPVVSIAGYLGGVFFGLGGLFILWRVFTDKPLARIDQDGVDRARGAVLELQPVAARDQLAADPRRRGRLQQHAARLAAMASTPPSLSARTPSRA
jgi:hypothetical protein